MLAHDTGNGRCSSAETQGRKATFPSVGTRIPPSPLASTTQAGNNTVLGMDFLYLTLGKGVSVRDTAVPHGAVLVLRDADHTALTRGERQGGALESSG